MRAACLTFVRQAHDRNNDLDEQLRRRKQDLQTFAEGYTVEESSKRVGQDPYVSALVEGGRGLMGGEEVCW